ncbi:hypothetical protein [Dongia deserti]|uniref:hypothetical protein n=1 Tax=Dongia deserti TaxID=2268030 RepID=UPI000E64D6B8|nr:hypothetical protein [Dongia deserti]
MTRAAILALMAAVLAGPACAGEANIVDVKVRSAGGGIYDFDVTIRSNDTGWDHYADAFEVLGPDGTVLGQRVLLHPHVEEQPFTRDLYGVEIPPGIDEVTVRARHKPKGYDGAVMTVPLPR